MAIAFAVYYLLIFFCWSFVFALLLLWKQYTHYICIYSYQFYSNAYDSSLISRRWRPSKGSRRTKNQRAKSVTFTVRLRWAFVESPNGFAYTRAAERTKIAFVPDAVRECCQVSLCKSINQHGLRWHTKPLTNTTTHKPKETGRKRCMSGEQQQQRRNDGDGDSNGCGSRSVAGSINCRGKSVAAAWKETQKNALKWVRSRIEQE